MPKVKAFDRLLRLLKVLDKILQTLYTEVHNEEWGRAGSRSCRARQALREVKTLDCQDLACPSRNTKSQPFSKLKV